MSMKVVLPLYYQTGAKLPRLKSPAQGVKVCKKAMKTITINVYEALGRHQEHSFSALPKGSDRADYANIIGVYRAVGQSGKSWRQRLSRVCSGEAYEGWLSARRVASTLIGTASVEVDGRIRDYAVPRAICEALNAGRREARIELADSHPPTHDRRVYVAKISTSF